MNIKQVRYFLTICEERHFTRAAKRCGVSQPSLTAAIQRLEREIGGTLFVRSTPVELSALGKALRPLFLRMRDTAERAQRIATSHARTPTRAFQPPHQHVTEPRGVSRRNGL